MTEQRVGLGVDLHPYAADDGSGPGGGEGDLVPAVSTQPGRPLVLGGVRFEGERPLRGHSDADVVAHAVADGVLGAAGLGDLGSHFPDTDDQWRGADSLELLAAVVARAGEQGWVVVNADCTVVGERPRIGPRREEMMERLSLAVGAPVHVKATRPEGLGSLGRLEGLACLAVVLIERQAGPAAT